MKSAVFVLLFFSASLAYSDNLNVTISGDSGDKADLETLSPQPTVPTAEEMTFSLDGGKSAVETEVIPMSVSEAALRSDLSRFQIPVLPTIPESPFVVLPVPKPQDPALAHFHPFGRPPFRQRPEDAQTKVSDWEFSIVDETNRQIYKQTGEGFPTGPFSWDGTFNNTLVLMPDKTYFPYLVLKSSSGLTVRIPGEAERYLCFSTRDGEDEAIVFGDRLYERGNASFSAAGQIFLDDLKQRLLQMDPRQTFFISIFSSSNTVALAESRRKTWISFLEETLGRKVKEGQIIRSVDPENRSLTQVTLRNFKDPSRMNMTGKARDLRPGLEDMKTWVQIKDDGKMWVVEMRHDRLFRAGSAYLRDEALPLITDALAKVRAINHGKKKSERKTILLRSYMKKPRELSQYKTFEEDPKLAALRSKVLFMLFAEANYLP